MELTTLKNRVGLLEEVLSDFILIPERSNRLLRQEMREFKGETRWSYLILKIYSQ